MEHFWNFLFLPSVIAGAFDATGIALGIAHILTAIWDLFLAGLTYITTHKKF